VKEEEILVDKKRKKKERVHKNKEDVAKRRGKLMNP